MNTTYGQDDHFGKPEKVKLCELVHMCWMNMFFLIKILTSFFLTRSIKLSLCGIYDYLTHFKYKAEEITSVLIATGIEHPFTVQKGGM